jgi:hypothetical protein
MGEDLRRAKQRLLKFLLRHGHIYSSKGNNWTAKHWQWIKNIQFSLEHERAVYEEYKSQIDSLEERLARMNQKVVEAAESQRYKAGLYPIRCTALSDVA